MTILDEAQKIQTDAKVYLDGLGEEFRSENKGKSVVVFPYRKEHFVSDDPVKANEITNSPKYQKEISFVFNL